MTKDCEHLGVEERGGGRYSRTNHADQLRGEGALSGTIYSKNKKRGIIRGKGGMLYSHLHPRGGGKIFLYRGSEKGRNTERNSSCGQNAAAKKNPAARLVALHGDYLEGKIRTNEGTLQ